MKNMMERVSGVWATLLMACWRMLAGESWWVGRKALLMIVILLALGGCTSLDRTVAGWHGIDMDAWDKAMCTPESLIKGACAPKEGVSPVVTPH